MLGSAGRTGATNAGEADGAETVDLDAGLAVGVVKGETAFEKFVAEIADVGADVGGGPGGAEEEDAAEADGEFHFGPAVFDGRGGGGEDVEGSVEEDGVKGVFVGAGGGAVREGDATGGVAVRGAEAAEGFELGAVAEAEVGEVLVESVDGDVGVGIGLPGGGAELVFGSFAAERADDVERPGTLHARVNGESAIDFVDGEFETESAAGLLG